MTKEWQEASNELAIAQKMNPIHGMRAAHSEALFAHKWLMSRDFTGITSEGYSGKGFVTTK